MRHRQSNAAARQSTSRCDVRASPYTISSSTTTGAVHEGSSGNVGGPIPNDIGIVHADSSASVGGALPSEIGAVHTDSSASVGGALPSEIGAVHADSSASVGGALLSGNAQTAPPTHFLLYLNKETFMSDTRGDAFAQEVRDAQASELPIAIIHEKDEARHGCEFGTFFNTTPQDLIDDGL
jgi:hypothetical protein